MCVFKFRNVQALMCIITTVAQFSESIPQKNSSLNQPGLQIRIPLGAIFDWDDKPAEAGFLFAISNFNSKKEEFQLSAVADVINVKDSFNLAQSICAHMSNGVFMLFGARRFESSNIVQSYTQTFHIPYVSPSYADNEPRNINTYQLHMKPSHTRALVDLIRHYRWKNFHYVYDSEEGLFSLQNILSVFEKENYEVHVRMRRLQDVANAHEDLRALDKQCDTDNEAERQIVFDLSTEIAYHKIMKQIREVGMNKQGYNYILGTLDFSNLEMERYQHGGVNITGFQLVNYNSTFNTAFLELWSTLNPNIYVGSGNKTIHIDAALAVDSLTVIRKTLSKLMANSSNVFKHTFRRGEVYNYNKTKGVPCTSESPMPWMHGHALMKGMKSLVFEGVTGHIEFDEAGFRKNYTLDIYNVGLNKRFKIGNWSPKGGVYTDNMDNGSDDDDSGRVKIWKVTSILDEPFLMERGLDKDGKPFIGNDRFEGYCADLAKHISDSLKIAYEINLVKDNTYGANITEGNVSRWNGMIGELRRKEADIAIAGLSITSEREQVVDFSKPFMDVGISIMIKKPEKKKPGVFSFMQPFTIDLWVCIVLGYFSVGIGIFFVSRFSSAEWRRSRINPNLKYNKFTIANSMWFAMGSLMLQGSDDTCPRSSSGRIIGGAWWFAVLITITSYTANLAAFLTIEKLMTPIESADDLVKQTEIAYGTLDSGSTQDFFRHSKVPTYQSMWAYMENAKPSVFVKNIEDGIKRVRNSKGKYAFLLESVHNEYANNRKPCNTMYVGHNLNLNHYGIATPKKSILRDEITLAVLSLKEDGTLEKMRKEWWIDKGECGFNTGHRESKKKSLSLSKVAGIYYILIAGLVLAIIVGVCEFIYIKSKPDTRMAVGIVYMMPAADTADTLQDDGIHLNNHKTENGPASLMSPMNGSAHTNNHHGDNTEKMLLENASSYNVPRISFDVDPHTSV